MRGQTKLNMHLGFGIGNKDCLLRIALRFTKKHLILAWKYPPIRCQFSVFKNEENFLA